MTVCVNDKIDISEFEKLLPFGAVADPRLTFQILVYVLVTSLGNSHSDQYTIGGYTQFAS
jgi:hypothetical protein